MDGELNEFSDERMLELIDVGREARPSTIRSGALLQAVQKWCGRSGPKDDVSILALEFGQSG